MNTPAHLIFAAAAFADPARRKVTAAALAGGLAPDLSLYLMVGTSLYLLDIPAREVFGQLYFSPAWQQVFAVDNSFVVWGVLLALAMRLRAPALTAFAGAGLLHLAFDFPLHHDDARRHFWPLTDWAFASPLSYWDRAHFGGVVGPIEIAACAGLTLVLLWRFRGWRARAGFAALFALEFGASGVWRFVF
jgi:hypothetical protein